MVGGTPAHPAQRAVSQLRAAVSAVRAAAAQFGPEEAFTARGLADHVHAILPNRHSISQHRAVPSVQLPLGLLDLPAELIVIVLAHCGCRDLCRVSCVCRLLGKGIPPPPPPRSPVEEALRLRAQAGGHWIPQVLPPGESSWTSILSWLEEMRAGDTGRRLAAGAHHTLLLDAGGGLHTAGTERPRQPSAVGGTPGLLGHTETGVVAPGVGAPTLVSPPRMVGALSRVPLVSVSAGLSHSLALGMDGTVYSWGCGKDGLLGHGDETSCGTPRRVNVLASHRVRCVAAGRMHSLAASREGRAWSWGQGAYDQLGHGGEEAGPQLPSQR